MSKHTPGPWIHDGQHVYAKGSFKLYVEGTRFGAKGSLVANARLIAAAPDLLAALKLCAGVVAGETLHKDALILALTKAQAAIRKAEEE